MADQGGEDAAQEVAGQVHGGGDLAGGTEVGVVSGDVEDGSYRVVGLFGEVHPHPENTTCLIVIE